MRHSKCSPLKWLGFSIVIIILVLCISAIVFLNVPSCKTWLVNKIASPKVDIGDIVLRDIGLTSALVDVTVCVQNTKSTGVTLDRISYTIYFEAINGNWLQLGTADRTQDVAIKGNSSTCFDISNQVDIISSIIALYQAYEKQGPINLKVTGSAWVKLWLISVEIPFERTKTISAIF
jgi:LEA14-like dessication related protein